jgi:hypothetical protein
MKQVYLDRHVLVEQSPVLSSLAIRGAFYRLQNRHYEPKGA